MLTLATALALVAPAVSAAAAPQAALKAKLRPKQLGAATAVSVGFHLRPPPGEALPPLSNFALRLPRGMGLAASELGLQTCSPSQLLELGADGCPRESLIGTGSAQVRVPFGTQVVSERARVLAFMARPVEERTTTLLYFDGRMPVLAPIVLQSQVVTPEGSSGSILDTPVQAIPTAPEGPEATMVALRTTLGPSGLRYYRRVGGRRVPYRPQGMSLPARCPQGGFRFAADFRFRDGSQIRATTAVPCPRRPR
ncbi:MAG TPA: hypothetical protein VFY69_07455 [Solirubrobacterales bacterium]|nr:hypothetical protein [Solirubrobacterales bacterium]